VFELSQCGPSSLTKPALGRIACPLWGHLHGTQLWWKEFILLMGPNCFLLRLTCGEPQSFIQVESTRIHTSELGSGLFWEIWVIQIDYGFVTGKAACIWVLLYLFSNHSIKSYYVIKTRFY
jgi:hypothetical protein